MRTRSVLNDSGLGGKKSKWGGRVGFLFGKNVCTFEVYHRVGGTKKHMNVAKEYRSFHYHAYFFYIYKQGFRSTVEDWPFEQQLNNPETLVMIIEMCLVPCC